MVAEKKKELGKRGVKGDILREFAAHPDLRICLWDRQVGLFYTKAMTPIKIGEKGMPDLEGYITLGFNTITNMNHSGFQPYTKQNDVDVAVKLYIETKAPGKGMKKEQREFKTACERNGCIHIVAESVGDVYAGIEEYVHRTGARV